MSASSSGCTVAPGGWHWPDNLPEDSSEHPSKTNPPSSTTQEQNSAGQNKERQHRKPERHWEPRTCRICLETILPTFHPPSEHLAGIFQGGPSVTYNSDDGRLIRPCKCTGSSRYVHESCLQHWRHADPSYGRRNFWQCPTCHFQYRLERMRWGRWITSKVTQVCLTMTIFLVTVFILGFIADPIINLYLDPYKTISSIPAPKSASLEDFRSLSVDEESSWTEHFLKGIASLGLLGFVKVFLTLSPWQWWNLRGSGFMSGSGGRAGTTGRDRLANISWLVVVLGTVWKGVRAFSRRVLDKAGERVVDVQGEEEAVDDDSNDTHGNT